jgi:hypothetical protein
VNEASRIAAMCRSVDQPVLMSMAFAAGCFPVRMQRIQPMNRQFDAAGRQVRGEALYGAII